MRDTMNKARAIILSQGKVLVMRPNDQNADFDSSVCFFPGGHIKEGESSAAALLRELEEEVSGLPEPRSPEILGVAEVKWERNGTSQTEVNFIYELCFARPIVEQNVRSKLSYMTVEWVNLEDVTASRMNLLPQEMAIRLADWLSVPPAIRRTIITKEGF